MEIILKFAHNNPWAGIAKYKNCYDYIGSYITRSGNLYTGLTNEEARDMENKLNYAEGTLDPTSSFWNTFNIRLGQKNVILNLEDPFDELTYKFLKKHRRVSEGLSNIRPQTDYVLINSESEAEAQNRINKIKREASSYFNKMSIEDMRKCLKIYGIKTNNSSNEIIENALFTEIEKNPKRYFELWVDNKNKQTQFLIEDAITKNIIRRNKNLYYYGTDVIGRSIDDTILFLDDKKNQDIKMAILNATEVKQ